MQISASARSSCNAAVSNKTMQRPAFPPEVRGAFWVAIGGTIWNALRFALRIISGKIIFILQFWKICGFSRIAFSQEGSWSKTALAAPLSAKARRCGGSLHRLSASAPSQALPRQLSQRESQAVKFNTKVLSTMRKCPAVHLALPLRKDFPRSGGRCRAATKGRIWQSRQALTERAQSPAIFDPFFHKHFGRCGKTARRVYLFAQKRGKINCKIRKCALRQVYRAGRTSIAHP